MKLALFDVDGTLVQGLSTELSFAANLWRHGRIGPAQLLAWLAFALRELPRYGRAVNGKNKAYLSGLESATVADWARTFVFQELPHKLCPAVVARLQDHKQAGDRVVLLTGTANFLAAPLAERLGADDYRAACYATRAGRFVAQPPLIHPHGAEKLRIAQELCVQQGTHLREVVAYADHPSDRRLLSAVGHPVVVGYNRRLRAEAHSRGWEQIAGCG
ncbi:MAG: HAD-IB family hydrolase [Gammaproteobacteria bacterium]|nr:HAD-IB family hydrolase [Gammaproteobacteria bacterium]MCP5425417.1 HAD-IB family hydrolase [Gammaproteobacteria bacterium]